MHYCYLKFGPSLRFFTENPNTDQLNSLLNETQSIQRVIHKMKQKSSKNEKKRKRKTRENQTGVHIHIKYGYFSTVKPRKFELQFFLYTG